MITIGWAFFPFYLTQGFPILEAPKWAKSYTVNVVFIIFYWVLFLVGQYLWRCKVRTRKFDINKQDDKDEPQKPGAIHVEVMYDKEKKESRVRCIWFAVERTDVVYDSCT